MSVLRNRAGGALCLLCIVVVNMAWGVHVRNSGAKNGLRLAGEAGQEPEKRPDDGGVPIQRARIDAFINQVAGYRTFDDVVAGMLDRPGGPKAFDIVFDAGVQSQDINPQTHFLQVLADRRTARLYAFLSEETPAEACRMADAVFREQLAAHRRQWEQELVIPEGGLGDRAIRNRLGMPLQLRYTRHATCVGMFLCACFCEPGDALAKLNEWEEELAGIKARIDGDAELSRRFANEFEMEGRIEPLYRLNLMFLVLDRHRPGLSQEVVDRLPGGLPPFLKLEQQPLCRWDAETNPFDFTAVHRGVQPDAEGALLQVRFRRDWANFQASPDAQRFILEKVTDAVREL